MEKDTIDVEAILARLAETKSRSALDEWLEASASRAEDFWLVMDRAVEIKKLAAGLVFWNEMSGQPCPVKYNQVRLAVRAREAARAAREKRD